MDRIVQAARQAAAEAADTYGDDSPEAAAAERVALDATRDALDRGASTNDLLDH